MERVRRGHRLRTERDAATGRQASSHTCHSTMPSPVRVLPEPGDPMRLIASMPAAVKVSVLTTIGPRFSGAFSPWVLSSRDSDQLPDLPLLSSLWGRRFRLEALATTRLRSTRSPCVRPVSPVTPGTSPVHWRAQHMQEHLRLFRSSIEISIAYIGSERTGTAIRTLSAPKLWYMRNTKAT